MEKHKKWIALMAAIFLLSLCLGLGILSIEPIEQPEPTYMTLPPEPTLGSPTDPDWISPYQKDAIYTRVLKDVWAEHINTDYLEITSTMYPNTDFTANVDVEDVISITIGKQYGDTDMTKAKVIGVSHEKMQDPYETPVHCYTPLCESSFIQNENDTWTAQMMIGYNTGVNAYMDLLFAYEDTVEYYTMFYVHQRHTNSEMYWKAKRPDSIVEHFTMKQGEDIYTYYYYPEDVNTINDWVDSETNVDKWELVNEVLVNADYTLYAHSQPLENGAELCLYKVSEQNPFPQHAFNPSESDLTYYIGAAQDDIIQNFGTPIHTAELNGVTQIRYENIVFYVHPEFGAIQIDTKPSIYPVVDGLPYAGTTDLHLQLLSRKLNTHMNAVLDKSDAANKYYVKTRAFDIGTCKIAYVWESTNNVDITTNEFTRIVIYSGEEYVY
jgi:hypothetical protein